MKPEILHALRIWEWRIWVLLLYALPLHEATKNTLWALALVLTSFRAACEKSRGRMDAAGFGVVVWVAAGLWATGFAIEPASSWKGLWDMTRAAGMFFLAARHGRSPSRREATVRHVLLAAAAGSAIGLFHATHALGGHEGRIERLALQIPSVGHYNQSGTWLAMAWMFALAGALHGRLVKPPALLAVSCLLVGLGLVATTSRTAIAVALIITLGTLWFARPRFWLRAGLLTLIPCVLLVMMASRPLRERFLFRGSFHNRTAIWSASIEAFRERPWTGVGLNNFKNVMLETDDPMRFATVDHAHNLYVNSLVQGGWPGLAALVVMLGSGLGTIVRLRKNREPSVRLVVRAALGVWLVAVLNGCSNTSLHHELSMLFFVAIGLAASAAPPRSKGKLDFATTTKHSSPLPS